MASSITTSVKGKEKASEEILLEESSSDDSSSAGSSDTESDSDSDSDSSNPSDSDIADPEYLESLLRSAKDNLAKRVQDKEVDDSEEFIQLGDGESGVQLEVPLPALDPGSSLPEPYFKFGSTKLDAPELTRDIDSENLVKKSSTSKAFVAPELKKTTEPLTRREKKALKTATAGSDWFDLPAPAAEDLPRLHREVEALRLRNHLDPKRFYRREEGEGKGIKGLPKYFAMGKIVVTPTPFGTATSNNLTRAERKRTIVDELVDDAEAKSYAKRKYDDLQRVRGERGRGTLRRKMESRKPKW